MSAVLSEARAQSEVGASGGDCDAWGKVIYDKFYMKEGFLGTCRPHPPGLGFVVDSMLDEIYQNTTDAIAKSHASYIYPGEGRPPNECSQGYNGFQMVRFSPSFSLLSLT